MFYDWDSFWRATAASIFTYSTIHHFISRFNSSKDVRYRWKNNNIATSFIHSTISSIISIYLFIENPAMCTTDIISSFTRHAYSFVSFELGYFIFDSIDNIRNLSGRHTFEILLHHIIIIGCFGISLYLGRYIGYCVISLFIEINSIFLHLRQLFLFSNKSKCDQIYRINNIINLGTFVVFRFGIVTFMEVWLIMNRSNVPLILSFIGHSGLLIMTIINGYLFYRLIRSDYSVKHQ
ncbi:unnamed protein product [Rotaria magnacalcarata]|uniref:TLC domain-containing protein n=1 Tax=Rotaria magnacalcarata TaxID=392030 RepID=A0A816W7R8_9BILA|nr:unnamed protein product [Rotaria magnacalcarata]CAF1372309.1 unnamed protein product [Rotaria magnacalcarata]CAF2053434.1 unnamed protein product [Rotaria magnacalcarata]CAF2067108.1 unnamed protein product [Rotaria magnacalcarata]CAF2132601.1 unnamed protein product [Rotaria magnacalcarata]